MGAIDVYGPPIGYGSEVVNGNLVNTAYAAAYDPVIFGAEYTTPNMWPRQGVYNVPPVMPSPEMQSTMAPAAYGGTGGNAIPTPTSETGNPFHPTKSPLIAAVVFLVFALAMLHYVHWK